MKNNARILKFAVLLMFVFLFNIVSVGAATTYTEGDYNYLIEDQSITITYYKGNASEVTVPNSLVGYPVSKLAKGAFMNASSLRKLNLPDTIVEIEEGALPEGITVIYDSNTERPQSSGITETDMDVFEGTTDVGSEEEKKEDIIVPSDMTRGDAVLVNDENNSGFSVEEVEITDDMLTEQSSGIDLDELNAAVKKQSEEKVSLEKNEESDASKNSTEETVFEEADKAPENDDKALEKNNNLSEKDNKAPEKDINTSEKEKSVEQAIEDAGKTSMIWKYAVVLLGMIVVLAGVYFKKKNN